MRAGARTAVSGRRSCRGGLSGDAELGQGDLLADVVVGDLDGESDAQLVGGDVEDGATDADTLLQLHLGDVEGQLVPERGVDRLVDDAPGIEVTAPRRRYPLDVEGVAGVAHRPRVHAQ